MWDILDNLKKFNESTQEYFTIIKTFFYYITHPKELLIWVWSTAVNLSFYVCLSIFCICLVLHLLGVKKARLYAQMAFFVYLTIMIFNRVM
jgi:hypothetical protein